MTQYIWQNGEMKPFYEATTHVMSHALHYGTSVFEGVRAYETEAGETVILCLDEHVSRFYYSASALQMKIPFTESQIRQAIIDTVKKNNMQSGYIRPLAYFGLTNIRVMPADDTPVDVIISCYSLKNYLTTEALHVKISDVIRIHPKSTNVEAKIGGHYVNSLQALLGIKNTKYGEVIMLDYDGYVAEGSSENIFIVKGKTVYTTERGTILNGITRGILIELIRAEGYELVETKLKPEELYDADEIIFCGTAVEVCGVASINDVSIADGVDGELTKKLKQLYHQICYGTHPKYAHLLTKV